MDGKEFLRWCGSVGTFYIGIPASIVACALLIDPILPTMDGFRFPAIATVIAVPIAVLGAYLAAASIAMQIMRGKGHPFDLDGNSPLSRPTQTLLTSGVYFWTRNPMGVGDVLLYAAIAVFVNSPVSLLTIVPFYTGLVWYNHRYNERPSLIARFGSGYLDYERSTSALFPGPKSLRKWRRVKQR